MATALRSSNTVDLGSVIRCPRAQELRYLSNLVEPKLSGNNVVWVNFSGKSEFESSFDDATRFISQMAMQPLKRELDGYLQLSDGWDGPASRAPKKGAVDAAMAFLSTITAGSKLPDIALGSDGEVNISWRGRGYFVDLSFYSEAGGSLFVQAGTKIKIPFGVRHFGDLPVQAHGAILVA